MRVHTGMMRHWAKNLKLESSVTPGISQGKFFTFNTQSILELCDVQLHQDRDDYIPLILCVHEVTGLWLLPTLWLSLSEGNRNINFFSYSFWDPSVLYMSPLRQGAFSPLGLHIQATSSNLRLISYTDT